MAPETETVIQLKTQLPNWRRDIGELFDSLFGPTMDSCKKTLHALKGRGRGWKGKLYVASNTNARFKLVNNSKKSQNKKQTKTECLRKIEKKLTPTQDGKPQLEN